MRLTPKCSSLNYCTEATTLNDLNTKTGGFIEVVCKWRHALMGRGVYIIVTTCDVKEGDG